MKIGLFCFSREPNSALKAVFWDKMAKFDLDADSLTLVIRDFIAILDSEDKLGGRAPTLVELSRLMGFTDKFGLLELPIKR